MDSKNKYDNQNQEDVNPDGSDDDELDNQSMPYSQNDDDYQDINDLETAQEKKFTITIPEEVTDENRKLFDYLVTNLLWGQFRFKLTGNDPNLINHIDKLFKTKPEMAEIFKFKIKIKPPKDLDDEISPDVPDNPARSLFTELIPMKIPVFIAWKVAYSKKLSEISETREVFYQTHKNEENVLKPQFGLLLRGYTSESVQKAAQEIRQFQDQSMFILKRLSSAKDDFESLSILRSDPKYGSLLKKCSVTSQREFFFKCKSFAKNDKSSMLSNYVKEKEMKYKSDGHKGYTWIIGRSKHDNDTVNQLFEELVPTSDQLVLPIGIKYKAYNQKVIALAKRFKAFITYSASQNPDTGAQSTIFTFKKLYRSKSGVNTVNVEEIKEVQNQIKIVKRELEKVFYPQVTVPIKEKKFLKKRFFFDKILSNELDKLAKQFKVEYRIRSKPFEPFHQKFSKKPGQPMKQEKEQYCYEVRGWTTSPFEFTKELKKLLDQVQKNRFIMTLQKFSKALLVCSNKLFFARKLEAITAEFPTSAVAGPFTDDKPRSKNDNSKGNQKLPNQQNQEPGTVNFEIWTLNPEEIPQIQSLVQEFVDSWEGYRVPKNFDVPIFLKTLEFKSKEELEAKHQVVFDTQNGFINGQSDQIEPLKEAIKNMLDKNKANIDGKKSVNETFSLKPKLLYYIVQKRKKDLFKPYYKLIFNPEKLNCTLSCQQKDHSQSKNEIESFIKKIQGSIIQKEFPESRMLLKHLNSNVNFIKTLERTHNVAIKTFWTSSKTKSLCQIQFSSGGALIISHGSIIKQTVDAIVNSCNSNLLHSDPSSQAAGVAAVISRAAGPDYQLECTEYVATYGPLPVSKVYVSKAGDLPYQHIFNLSVPCYEGDQNLNQKMEELRASVLSIYTEANKRQISKIALPLISAGVYGFPAEEVANVVLDSFAAYLNGLKNNDSLKTVILVDINDARLQIVQKVAKQIFDPQMNRPRALKYQWQWQNDKKEMENYDHHLNRIIDEEYEKNSNGKVFISFPVMRTPGSHTVNLDLKILTHKSTGKQIKLQRDPSSWSWARGTEGFNKMPPEISEILDNYEKTGQNQFELFLKEYEIDFSIMNQFNRETKFPRIIRNQPINKIPVSTSPIIIPKYKMQFLENSENLTTKNTEDEIVKLTIQGCDPDITTAHKKIKENYESNLKNQIFDLSVLHDSQRKEIQKEIKKIGAESAFTGNTVSVTATSHVIMQIASKVKSFEDAVKLVISIPTVKYPPEWETQQDDVSLFKVLTKSPEWDKVESAFKKTLPGKNIIEIQRIQNKKLWRDYYQEVEDMKKRKSLTVAPNQELLWHGTRSCHPKEIYNGQEEGLDLTFANVGMWGRGLYFAVNSSYSDGYAYNDPSGSGKLFMLVTVLIGDTIAQQPNSNLSLPPYKDPNYPDKGRYDSVQGETGGSTVYILYRMRRAYPSYLVRYM